MCPRVPAGSEWLSEVGSWERRDSIGGTVYMVSAGL
jgi:hypothetical protein